MSGPRTVPTYLLSVLIAFQLRCLGCRPGARCSGRRVDRPVGGCRAEDHLGGRTGAQRAARGHWRRPRQHLAHEVLLTNTAFFPIALKRLDTVDPATGAILESLRGAALTAPPPSGLRSSGRTLGRLALSDTGVVEPTSLSQRDVCETTEALNPCHCHGERSHQREPLWKGTHDQDRHRPARYPYRSAPRPQWRAARESGCMRPRLARW
jgi:hypothetical protein